MKAIPIAFTILILSILFPALTFGQKNFQSAKVITLTGDTISGLIDYQKWDKNPKLISFKSDSQALLKSFQPLSITGFIVNNEQYRSAIIAVENSPQRLDELSTTAAPIYRTDTTFLRALVTGPHSLYRYKANDREYFYIEQQGKFDLLVYKQYKLTAASSATVYFNNQFLNQLKLYLAACPTIEQRLRYLRYTAGNLQSLFEGYYTCSNQQPAFLLKNKTVNHFGVLAGLSRATVGFNPTPYPSTPTLDNYTDYGVTGGIFFNFSLPGNRGSWSINNELMYNSFTLHATSSPTYSSDIFPTKTDLSLEFTYLKFPTKTDLSLEFTYLKLNTLLRFTHSGSSGISLFANAGISNGYALHTATEKTVTTKFTSYDRVTTSEAFPEPRRYEQGFIAGIGAGKGKFSAEARYERSNGFLDGMGLASSFARYSLLFGYRFH